MISRNIYIVNCYFHDMSVSGSGGALYILSGNTASTATLYYLLIETCTFVSCSCTSNGGAIYSRYGNNVLHNVCGTDCQSDNNEGFAVLDGSSSTSIDTKNYVNESSIANCKADGSYTMYHLYGNIQYKSVNLSNNNVYYTSAIYCYPNQKDGNGIATSISYSSFSNNTAETYYCIYLYYDISNEDANQYEINMTNIIYNTIYKHNI